MQNPIHKEAREEVEEAFPAVQEKNPPPSKEDHAAADDSDASRDRKVLCTYFGVICLLLILVTVVGLLTGAGAAAGWGMDIPAFLFVLSMTFYPCCGCLPDDDDGDGIVSSPPTLAQPTAPKKRMHWLDNLKTCLICMVLLGHSAMTFFGTGSGINFSPIDLTDRSYFNATVLFGLCVFKPLVVPLFFFISGFFAPSSLDRKGRRGFLKASFMRLGLVFLLFWLVVNPLMQFYAAALVKPSEYTPSYFPTSPHTWFLLWLLVFQCGLASLRKTGHSMPLPSFSNLACLALKLAVIQLVASVMMAICGSSLGFAEMPMSGPGGDGFFNALGFAGGVTAKRSGWLNEKLPGPLVASARKYTIAVSLVLAATWCTLCLAELGNPVWVVYGVLFAAQIPLGPFCVAIGVVFVDLFMTRANFENGLTKFMAGAAFGVYLIHYYAVNTFAWLFSVVLKTTQSHELKFDDPDALKCDEQIGDADSFGGLFFVFACSLVTSFAVAGLLKLAPGLRNLI